MFTFSSRQSKEDNSNLPCTSIFKDDSSEMASTKDIDISCVANN